MRDHHRHEHEGAPKERSTAVLDVRGLAWASQQSTVAAVLGRPPGVLEVEANPATQSATVVFDPRRTSPAEPRRWVEECGYHCAGQSVPSHICDEQPPSPAQSSPPPPAQSRHRHHGLSAAEHNAAQSTITPLRAILQSWGEFVAIQRYPERAARLGYLEAQAAAAETSDVLSPLVAEIQQILREAQREVAG